MRVASISIFILTAVSAMAVALADGPALVPVDQIPVPPARGPVVTVAATPATAPPATQPVAASAAAWSKVVVLPFEALGDADRREWIVRAVQQSLVAQAARLAGIVPISEQSPVGSDRVDTAAALDAAKTAGADGVVFGACQFIGTEMRITGQIIDVHSGAAVAGLKAGGEMRDLFDVEDQLDSQLARALRPQPIAPPVVAQGLGPQNNSLLPNPAPQLTADDLYPPPYNVALANAYNSYYYNPGTPYAYGYGGYGFGYSGFYAGGEPYYGGYSAIGRGRFGGGGGHFRGGGHRR